MQLGKRNALLAIAVGGLIAGALDITQAIILFGKKVPLVIAAGLLGKGALHDGGAGTYVLGLFLHFFIAMSVATIYYAASRRLRFLSASRSGSVQASRAPRDHCPQRRNRSAHLFQRSTVREIVFGLARSIVSRLLPAPPSKLQAARSPLPSPPSDEPEPPCKSGQLKKDLGLEVSSARHAARLEISEVIK